MWACWKALFIAVRDGYTSVQQIRKRACCYPWITADVKQLILDRNKKKCKAILLKKVLIGIHIKHLGIGSILLYDTLKPDTTVIKGPCCTAKSGN